MARKSEQDDSMDVFDACRRVIPEPEGLSVEFIFEGDGYASGVRAKEPNGKVTLYRVLRHGDGTVARVAPMTAIAAS